jgi:hypothetical protein
VPPALYKALRVVLDLGVILLCIVAIVRFSTHRAIECRWERLRATCSVEVVDAFGRVQRDDVEEIRGAAYRSGSLVGLVTDARHKGEHALFGTHEVELDSDADAERLRLFAVDRDHDALSIASGVAHPLALTVALLACLTAYGEITRRRRRAV